jgi:alkylation response protein AidB-like acyl-CoA dehydrogenase
MDEFFQIFSDDKKMNYYSDSSEWKYLFRSAIEWDKILPLYYPEFPTSNGFNSKEELIEFFEQVLDATGKWSGETLRSRAKELDEVGCAKAKPDGSVELSEPIKKTYEEAVKLDVFGACVDEKYGGLGIPVVVGLLLLEQVARACISSSTQIAFFTSMADMLERFCDEATCKRLIPQILKGEISGSMCLTEPDAGSDVGALRTSAVKQADGRYLLNGTKMFITNAGGGFGFVLARVKDAPEGLAGISLFLAEEKLDGKQNYRITKIEEKMGMHGSMTCEVVYENSVAALVGVENEGFKYMLHLMNEARISVGLQSIGGIEAGLERAKEYSEGRKQFGKPISELPLFKRNFEDWTTEQDAFRAFMVDTISSFDIFQRLDLKMRHAKELTKSEEKLHKTYHNITRTRTPLVKYSGSELYSVLSTKSIQAFGGYGYMKEYEVDRIHRDCFGALLYEGTSQIQALMAMKDYVKKVTKNPSKYLQSMMAAHPVGTITEKDEHKKAYLGIQYEFQKEWGKLLLACFKNPKSTVLDSVMHFNQLFSKEYWQDSDKLERLMTHAETLCQALTLLEIIKVLGKHASKDKTRVGLFQRYLVLAKPRLQAIYADWNLRS